MAKYHLPNKLKLINQAGLSPTELMLFINIIETESLFGLSAKSQITYALETGLTAPTIIKAKKGLEEKSVIHIEKTIKPSGRMGCDKITTYMSDEELFEKFREHIEQRKIRKQQRLVE